MDLTQTLSREFSIGREYVSNIVALIDDGNTIPFIARYRKEMTGSCDDQVLRVLSDRLVYLRNLEKRRTEIRESIEAQGKMTEDLAKDIERAATLAEVEDLYRPYRPKRRTRAMVAREKGLEPLADRIFIQDLRKGSMENLASSFVDTDKGVDTWEEAVAGARDIIAERISDDADMRKQLRALINQEGTMVSQAKEDNSVYAMYADYKEPLSRMPSHRILAINRGEREGALKVEVAVDDGAVLSRLDARFVKPGSVTTSTVAEAAQDAWNRLMKPSLERELRSELTERASKQAISMFALNLKPLLLQPPVRGRVTLGLDPAYRTGCKIAVVDATGKVLHTTVVYPTPPQNKTEQAKEELGRLIKEHNVSVIAIGNGTASREAEAFVAGMIRELGLSARYVMVNEAGASVYSASKLAAEEFPDFDLTLRSAVSIARRLQDPLAELVKIDPKSIGVGQYQHDMPAAQLDGALTGVVEDCVNSVGVDLNTASAPLLTYISGLNESVARNIVSYREANGRFRSRTVLKKVPRLGPKAFEQSAGFLRISEGADILDNTSVHPESYEAARKLLAIFELSLQDVSTEVIKTLPGRVREMGEDRVAVACGVGVPTLRDMIDALLKPGRDPRDEMPAPQLRSDVLDIADLKAGMELTGTVRNVIDFGAFVDIGVHQDGLVHISELADRYIRHPSDVVKVGDVVNVRVLGVDSQKKRISLTMKKQPGR